MAVLTITPYRYDLSYHYFGICNAVCGSRSFGLIVAAVTVYSAPDDGRKGRPKHVEF